ncbi:hypothetical protein LJR289_003037 [Pseudoduganella sp. LjRoot289]|uniref:hypothetical protein n=1 Tax=Pseudoduganella sp. LjRoot289 TaxID=3342314 RepID=UPI003ECC42A1
MAKLLWGWTIPLGLLLARMGYDEVRAADSAQPELTATLLLTCGLLSALLGLTGMTGVLAWIPRPGRTHRLCTAPNRDAAAQSR